MRNLKGRPPMSDALRAQLVTYRVNPLVARIAALAAVVVLTPLLYVALWVLMPDDAP